MDRTRRASRALVASLVVNGALVGLLFAIAPRASDPPVAAPTLLDVSIAAPLPRPVAPVIVSVAPGATSAPVGPARHARAPRAAPPAPTAFEHAPVDDPAASGTSGDVGSGDGNGNGSGDGGGGTGGGGSPGAATTMPIPLGSRDAQLPYTREALVARTEGNVLVRVLVGADGKVSEATLARGLGHGLDAIALGLAAKLEFQPARDALGQATAARITWKFHFAPPRNAASL